MACASCKTDIAQPRCVRKSGFRSLVTNIETIPLAEESSRRSSVPALSNYEELLRRSGQFSGQCDQLLVVSARKSVCPAARSGTTHGASSSKVSTSANIAGCGGSAGSVPEGGRKTLRNYHRCDQEHRARAGCPAQ